MNRLDKIKQEFLEQFTDKLKEEKVDLSVESAFDILISADPSRNKKNVRWLIESYLDDGYLWEDIQSGPFSKVYETLNTFIRNKNKLDIVDRSINRYQSIADMWKMVKQYADDKTGKEIKREEHDRAMAETEIVIDNDDMRIVVPLTEYAAKFHGRGTRWCTAADNDNRFWEYAEEAPLFIITLKESGDKLQLWKNGNNVQFMDADDSYVEDEYIQTNWSVFNCIVKYTGSLQYVPYKYMTPELCEMAVKKDGCALYHIPNEYKTPELCKIAVEKDSYALQYVPDEFKTPELCRLVVQQNGMALNFIPLELITPELCKLAVGQDGVALNFVPDMTSDGVALKTYELYKIACEQSGYILQYVPKKIKTPELCKLACEQNGLALHFVPNEFLTTEIYKIACKQNGHVLELISPEFRTPELCKIAVKKEGYALQYVPHELITPELCKLAVGQDGIALRFVPHELITPELCKLAVQQNGMALRFVPDVTPEGVTLKTPELCKMADEKNGPPIEFIPEETNKPIIPMNIYRQEIGHLKESLSLGRLSSNDTETVSGRINMTP